MAWVQAGVDLLTGLLLFRALMGIAVSLAELVELERERERERATTPPHRTDSTGA